MEKDWVAGQEEGPVAENQASESVEEVADIDWQAKLNEELKQQQEESRKNHDNYLRALAEVENIKKRSQRDREEYLKYANAAMIKRLLPIIDDLHRAIGVARNSQDFEALSKGVEMTARNLDELLLGEGVKVIESLGQPFDPQYHQALSVESSDQYPENTVIEELQPGYILHDRVIRPSLVKVSS